MKPPIVSVISKKNTGKTTLIEKMIPELKQRGFKVGTVKHDLHGFTIDHEGKDTWRHKEAGAETVVISSPWKISVIKDVEAEMALTRIVEQYFAGMDIVLTEGYKKAGMPQIEVYRRAAHDSPIHSKGDTGSLIAVVSDTPLDLGVPCFDIEDIKSLVDFIQKRFL